MQGIHIYLHFTETTPQHPQSRTPPATYWYASSKDRFGERGVVGEGEIWRGCRAHRATVRFP